jgi:hypothetical protein
VKFKRVVSAVTVVNPATASEGAGPLVTTFIENLHPALFFSVALAYFSAVRPTDWGTNAFSIYGWILNELGQRVRLSDVPINGTTGQPAPDAWEGSTTLPILELVHTTEGQQASETGRWEVVVTIGEALEMCEADFLELANQVTIRATPVTLS